MKLNRPGYTRERGRCKCGGIVLLDTYADGSITSHHEAPLCDSYKALLAELPTPSGSGVSLIDPEDG